MITREDRAGTTIRWTSFIIGWILIVGQVCGKSLHVPSEYSTIQSAIDAAGNGDAVRVAGGEYQYNESLLVHNKTLTLCADSPSSRVLLRCSYSSSYNGALLRVDEYSSLTLEDFHIEGRVGVYTVAPVGSIWATSSTLAIHRSEMLFPCVIFANSQTIVIDQSTLKNSLSIAGSPYVTIRNTTTTGLLTCKNIQLLEIMNSRLTGAAGTAGGEVCSVKPVFCYYTNGGNGGPALELISCPWVALRDCIISGGNGGSVLQSYPGLHPGEGGAGLKGEKGSHVYGWCVVFQGGCPGFVMLPPITCSNESRAESMSLDVDSSYEVIEGCGPVGWWIH